MSVVTTDMMCLLSVATIELIAEYYVYRNGRHDVAIMSAVATHIIDVI